MAKIKKAQGGNILVKKKQTPSGSMSKYKSDDGNYTTKIKYKAGQEPTEENPEFRGTYKKRRTLKGFLTGAPKPMKKGGKVKMQAGGTTKSTGKAPDKKGDYITVQKRTLGNMKKGGKVASKKK
jgi:hypothetical protein